MVKSRSQRTKHLARATLCQTPIEAFLVLCNGRWSSPVWPISVPQQPVSDVSLGWWVASLGGLLSCHANQRRIRGPRGDVRETMPAHPCGHHFRQEGRHGQDDGAESLAGLFIDWTKPNREATAVGGPTPLLVPRGCVECSSGLERQCALTGHTCRVPRARPVGCAMISTLMSPKGTAYGRSL